MPRAKQLRIPGTEPGGIAELDTAADSYYDTMQSRLKLTKEEDEAKTTLIEAMKRHQVKSYESTDGIVVTVSTEAKDSVKVKKKQEPEEEGGEDGE